MPPKLRTDHDDIPPQSRPTTAIGWVVVSLGDAPADALPRPAKGALGVRQGCPRGCGFAQMRGAPSAALPVPPSAAQRLEQRSGVAEAVGFSLDAGDERLLIGAFG